MKLLFTLVLSLITINAHAADYYDQFVFSAEGSCVGSEYPYFHEVHSWVEGVLGTNEKGYAQKTELSVQLMSDHTYWADYMEMTYDRISDGPGAASVYFRNQFEGQWTVEGDRILLSNFGYGVPVKYSSGHGSADGIQFTITNTPHDPRALNTSMVLSHSLSTVGPRGQSINEYCGRSH